MIKKILFVAFVFNCLACSVADKKDFNTVKSSFITEYSQIFPDEIPLPSSGKNNSTDYLNQLMVPDSSKMDTIGHFIKEFTEELKSFNQSELSPEDAKDWTKMHNILKTVNTFWEGRKSNPDMYNVLFGFQRILNSDFNTPEIRLQIIFNKLAFVPQFYEAAKTQVNSATVEKSDATIEKHLATFEFFDSVLPSYINQHHHMTPQYQARLNEAKYAVKDFVAYVESLRLN